MAFVGFDTVSKGPFHNYYGIWGVNPGTGGPTTGVGVPNCTIGDLYYNDGSVGGATQIGLYVCTTGGAFGAAVWQMLGVASLDKRESKYIVGNSINGDTVNNSDYLGGAGLRTAILAVGFSTRRGGRIYIREGTYTGADAVPAPTGAPFYAPYQLSEAANPNSIQNGIWIDGAGRQSVRLVNPATNSGPLFILDNDATSGNNTFMVRIAHMTLVGCGNILAKTTVGPPAPNGFATVEVGYSAYETFPTGTPKNHQNVTLEDVDIDANGDACGLGLFNSASKGCDSFRGIDLHVSNCKCVNDANGQFVIGWGGMVTTDYVELSRVRTDAINAAAAKGSGILAFMTYYSSLSECWSNGNINGGFFFQLCEDVAFDQCRAVLNKTLLEGVQGAGFYVENSKDVRLESCYASRTLTALTNGFGAEDYLLDLCNNCILDSCISDGVSTPGAKNNGFTLNTCLYTVLSACESYWHLGELVSTTGYGRGFSMITCEDCEFLGCTAHDCGQYGFVLRGAIARCMVDNCNASKNGLGWQLPGVGHGIFITGTTNRVLVNDCIGYYNQGFGTFLDTGTTKCEIVGGAYIANGGVPNTGPYVAQVYDAVGGTTTNELSHFQFT